MFARLLPLFLLLATPAMAIEKLDYRLIESDGAFELRDYGPYKLASVNVDAEFEQAGNAGFRPLFGYIDGQNADQTSIAMTAPVLQRRTEDGWQIAFTMPSAYDQATPPAPADDRVQIGPGFTGTMAAIKYRGTWSEARYLEHESRLRELVAARALKVCGAPIWARYDPPFMPWFMRRNEILLPVAAERCP